jgi:hypothetical protein
LLLFPLSPVLRPSRHLGDVLPLLRLYRHHGQTAHANQREIRERGIGFDRSERDRVRESLAGLDLHDDELGILGIRISSASNSGQTHDGLHLAGVINHDLIPNRHLAKMLEGDGIAHSVPHCVPFFEKAIEGVGRGLGLENPVSGHVELYAD